MPKKSGKDAYDEIRMMGGNVRAIFISGYLQDAIRKKGLLEEGCDLVMKPVSPQNLLRKIREVLDR
jgi:DNA-binding response OmpR family regulator